jgi:hypothetical protein
MLKELVNKSSWVVGELLLTPTIIEDSLMDSNKAADQG